MTRHDPYGARQELRQRILAKLADRVGLEQATLLAGDVAEMFYTVADEWDRIDTTTLGDPGQTWMDNRFLVARLPVQGVSFSRRPDRTVVLPGPQS